MTQPASDPIDDATPPPPRKSSARSSARRLVAVFTLLAVNTIWLGIPYLCWRGLINYGPFAGQRGGPLGESLCATELWPCGLTITLALIALPRTRRGVLTSIAVIATVVSELLLVMPGVYR